MASLIKARLINYGSHIMESVIMANETDSLEWHEAIY